MVIILAKGSVFVFAPAGFVLTALGGYRTALQSIGHANPGGSIPTWFLNNLLSVAPPKVNRALEQTSQRFYTHVG